jgi:hypothetical protein
VLYRAAISKRKYTIPAVKSQSNRRFAGAEPDLVIGSGQTVSALLSERANWRYQQD